MGIYKLNDITSFVRGCGAFQKKDLLHNGEFIALHYGKTYKKDVINNDFEYYVGDEFYKKKAEMKKGDIFLISTSETLDELGKVVFYNADIRGLLGGEQIKLLPNDLLINNKYLYYWLFLNKKIWSSFATGLSVYRFKGKDFSNVKIYLPSKNQQKKIIDIIEPIEQMLSRIDKLKENLSILTKNLSKNNYIVTNYKYDYKKGNLPIGGKGNTVFLNVSAANGKINRLVENEANIFPGDVTLSLDGNIGLVNNNLYGFNGYLYKVESDLYTPSEIYYSLKHNINQKIMQINKTGTTIKHSTNSKKEIRHIKIMNFNTNTFFFLEIHLENIRKQLLRLQKNIVKLLIK